MKPCVYILRANNDSYCIGSTEDISRRMIEHNSGKTKSLANKLPVTLLLKQEFETIAEARQVEYKLKSKKSRKIIETILQNGVIEIK